MYKYNIQLRRRDRNIYPRGWHEVMEEDRLNRRAKEKQAAKKEIKAALEVYNA